MFDAYLVDLLAQKEFFIISGPTVGAVLGWTAQHAWGYGYWAPYLLDLQVTIHNLSFKKL